METKTLLITGFMPFGGDTRNPSWEAVSLLPDTVGAYRLFKLLLPVEFGHAAQIAIKEAEAIGADAILCVGLAAGRPAITPERIGINLREARIPDNAGFAPMDKPVVPDGPDAYFSTLPVRSMTEAIVGEKIPAVVSYSAGTYVCNDLLYTLLYHFHGTGTRVAFIHVPSESETFPLSVMSQALCAAIKAI